MKKFLGLCLLLFVGIVGWRIGEKLSADALGMALGVLFGVMAGIPAALMVLAAHRRENEYGHEQHGQRRARHQQQQMLPYQPQPPVIVMAAPSAPQQQVPAFAGGYGQGYGNSYGGGYGAQGGYQQGGMPPMLSDGRPQTIETRQFRVVGETEGWVEEFE